MESSEHHNVAPATKVTREPIAHLQPDGTPHLLRDHLNDVGELAATFATWFGASAWARLAGVWHDLGKYSFTFQRRIREENGFEAHLEIATAEDTVRDHSSAGAVLASRLPSGLGIPIAFVIAGHHTGLPDQSALKERLSKRVGLLDESVRGGVPADLLNAEAPTKHSVHSVRDKVSARRLEFWTRMLFSTLCDADFLDTERFYDRGRSAARAREVTLGELRAALVAQVASMESAAHTHGLTEVQRVRAEVRDACIRAASSPQGFFSLTVPTGGGKTLASMNFALAHAESHGLRRVVVAVPYTAIIEQNADAYRTAFGPLADEAMVEHFSALDPRRETWRNRISSENWDAPVIVTTTVQLFESLFGCRTSRCRKLHNIARSVIVLDEAQTLPLELLNTVIDGLRTLVEDYGVTVVFCTATQPAFRAEDSPGRPEPWRIRGMREIVPPEVRAFERLRRVAVRWPTGRDVTEYTALAEEIAAEPDVLAIVHRRADARTLVELLDACLGHTDTVHLSALMTPAHRSRLLRAFKARRDRGEQLRAVATPLVEAGVNLDFPTVYRALAGMDAMAQAAGRCNREGRLTGLGALRVFIAETAPPPGVLQRALAITRAMLDGEPALDLFAPETHRRFFTNLYRTSETDAPGVQEMREQFKFASVGAAFQMIEDGWAAPVVIPEEDVLPALTKLRAEGPSRGTYRRLQRHTVNVPRRVVDAWVRSGRCELIAETVVVLREIYMQTGYSERFGLDIESIGGDVIDPELLTA